MAKKTTCSRPGCDNPRRYGNQRYCKACHAEYMRLNPQKPYAQYTEEEKIKQRARMIANRAKRAGVLVPEPCKCGELKVQMHHDDYSKPLEIVWICKICHAKHHKNENMVKKEPLLAL